MQRDWMRDERGVPFVRTINNIQMVEESRHMKFARHETRKRLTRAGRLRRQIRSRTLRRGSGPPGSQEGR